MNKRLLILSGIAIIAVVANHASLSGFVAMFWWTDRYLPVAVPNYDQMGSFWYYALVAQQKLALFSVPSFLFVSGAFIAYAARGSQSRLGWAMIKNRIINLLPPYFIWGVVYILGDIFIQDQQYTIQDVIFSFITINKSPFFFIPLLIVYFLLSPFLAHWAKNSWKPILIVVSLIEIGAIANAYVRFTGLQSPVLQAINIVFSSQIVEYIFFYVLGLILGFQLTLLKENLFRIRWLLLISTIVFAVLAVAEAEWVFQNFDNDKWRSITLSLPTFLYATSFIFTFLAFEHVTIPLSDFFYRMGVGTLAIYLIHQLVLMVLPKIIYHVAPGVLGYQVLYQPLLISIAIAIPSLMMNITQRTPLRKYYRILYG